jgi:hypothetical protein
MSADLALSKFDFNKYHWIPVPTQDGSECRIRPLAGAESVQDVYNTSLKGDQTLFFAACINLGMPVCEQDLVTLGQMACILT